MINEGVKSRNNEDLAAYMIVVAENYAKAPVHDPQADRFWVAMNRSNIETLMKRLGGSRIDLRFTSDDPYAQLTNEPLMMTKLMLYDMTVNHQLIIFSGASQHPVLSEEENIAFRAVHDFFAHGKIRTSFFEQIKRVAVSMGMKTLPVIQDAIPLLSRVNMAKFGNRGFLFNGRGELNAAAAHIRFAPREAAPALFCEVVGQVSYQIVTGNFGQQKVALLKGFDYNHLGVCLPNTPQEKRYREVLQQLSRGTVKTLFGEISTESILQRVANGVA